MKFTPIVLLLLVLLNFTSCIPIKKLTYLQEPEETEEEGVFIPVVKTNAPYRVTTYDLLSIRIKALDQTEVGMFNPVNEENLNATGEQQLYTDGFVVDVHGNIRIPTIGDFFVLGLTVEEIRTKIEKILLEEYFKDGANLFITVKLAGIRYTINGEIGSPGSNIIYRDQLTIMEAIANSGDITLTGDRENVVIIRQYPLGQKVHHIDLTKIDAMASPYYYVQPNDLILVNPLPQKSIGAGTTGLSSFTTILTVFTALTTVVLLFIRL